MLPEDKSILEPFLAARAEAGFDDVPLALDSKSPNLPGWSDVESFHWPAFVGKNIGNRGTRVVAIDFDDPVCAQIAVRVFDLALADAGGVVFDGRPSKPVSHVYISVPDGAPRVDKASSPFSLTNYHAPFGVDGVTYCIEVKHHRGLQAMTAPSVHPGSGEALVWQRGLDGEVVVGTPAVPEMSCASVERLLACIWLSRALAGLWGEGRRHHLMLWAGTWLHQAGVSREEAAMVAYGLLESSVVSTSDAQGRADDFRRDWDAQEGSRGHRGRSGVEEVVGLVHGAENVGAWFDRVARVWPCLGRSGGVAGATSGLVASSGGSGVWTPPEAEKLFEAAVGSWTWITSAGANGMIHDGSSLMTLMGKRTAMGHVGQIEVGPRGGQTFTSVVDLWTARADKRVARDTAYLPGHPSGAVSGDGLLNLFSRGPIWQEAWVRWQTDEPVSPSQVQWFIGWMQRVFPEARERQLLLVWIAHLLLWPEKRPGWAPYLVTPVEGVGRTSVFELLGRIMGSDNVVPVSMGQLNSQFTDWAGEGVLRYVSETREPGESRGGLSKKLHDYITDGTVAINRKRLKPITVPNHGGYVLISNSPGDFHIRASSRRFCVIECGHTRPNAIERHAFFSHALGEDEEPLVRLCQWFLQQEEWAAELPKEAPHTAGRDLVIESSASYAELAVQFALEDLEEVFTLEQFMRGHDGPAVTSVATSKQTATASVQLRAAGYGFLRSDKNRIRYRGKRHAVYCHLDNMQTWKEKEADEIRAALAKNDKKQGIGPNVIK